METAILTGGVDAIDAIAEEWEALCEEGCNEPFLRPEWFRAFVKNFGLDIELFTVRREGNLRAILPIAVISGTFHGIPVRKLSAAYNLNTPRFDLIHGADPGERAATISCLWNVIRSRGGWNLLEFRLVKADSWLSDLIELSETEKHYTGVWKMDSAPFISLPCDDHIEKFEQRYYKTPARKHLGSELNRRFKRLKELGEIEVKVTNTFSPEMMKMYFELERKGWKGRGGTDAAKDPRVAQLHNDFSAAVAQKGALVAFELKLDGRTIAMFFTLRYGARSMYWKTSYDEEFRRYSPGNILFREYLRDCIREGITEVDMLSPSTGNKRVWATGEREHVAFYVFRPGIVGTLLWTWKFGVIARLRELTNKTPETYVPAEAQG